MSQGEAQGPSPEEMGINPPEQKEQAPKWKPIGYEGCLPDTPKGAVVDLEQLRAQKAVVVDTGAFASFLEDHKEQETFSEEEIDGLYRETIAAGAIDHHSIDQFLGARGLHPEKCSTQMVVDYSEAVVDLLSSHEIQVVHTHYDSDLDAVASSYLVRALVQNGELPAIARDLAAVANRLDYGKFDIVDPEQFLKTLPGIFETIKSTISDQFRAEISEKGFSPALAAKYENKRNKMVFAILNRLNQAMIEGQEYDLAGDCTGLLDGLDEEIISAIRVGQEKLREEYQKFLEDFTSAEKHQTNIRTKEGGQMDAEIVVAQSNDPLMFTNLAYMRIRPETIVAVYAGEDRRSGDHYDIGIIQDQARVMDLRELCLALNKAERQRRDILEAKNKSERTKEEQGFIDKWEQERAKGPGREAFPGLREMVERGEVSEDDILDVDPTPLVAGGSLIPASHTSLLSEKGFKQVILDFIEQQKNT
jgi:hypothetical protein